MRKKNKEKRVYPYKFIAVAIFMLIILFTISMARNYVRNDVVGKTNLVINSSNVTKSLKNDVIIENDVIYISTKDIKNFFDDHIYYDDKYNQIITSSDMHLATFKIGEKKCNIDGSDTRIVAATKKNENDIYLPFSEISKGVYNVETKYIKATDTVVLESLDRELVYANSRKKNGIKYKPTMFSKTVDKIGKGDNITILNEANSNLDTKWKKVRTQNGKIGYVKTDTLANEQQVRSEFKHEKQIDGNISMVWDYFSQYASAPQRTGKIKGVNVVSPTFFSLQERGKGNIIANVGKNGENYINWAHSNGYKVWALISNDSKKDTTSEILNDYELRKDLINNIVNVAVKYKLDGINLDFENIYEKDKDMYSRLVIELAPRLKDLGKVLSVDVTAPDGSPDWSLCYDRNVIADVADYICFMAYDQNGISSPTEGTTAGHDWVETNLKKFLEREEVKADKIILGTPFYTRVWSNENGKIDSRVIDMKDIYNSLPDRVDITWDDELKQNIAEYENNGKKYKIWIEDKKSMEYKLNLVDEYNIAGAAYWEKDRENEEIWDLASRILKIE